MQCQGCEKWHIISDNISWFVDEPFKIQQILQTKNGMNHLLKVMQKLKKITQTQTDSNNVQTLDDMLNEIDSQIQNETNSQSK